MWERRYGFPKPLRNAAQARLYSNADIEQLVLVSRALKAGFRAGEVIHRSPEELRLLLEAATRVESEPQRQDATPIKALLQLLCADDLNALRTELRRAVATLGPKRFLTELAGPLVEEVGNAWASGMISVRHEHALSEVLSTQLRLLLSVYEDTASGPTVLLCTLSNEEHGLGLEMVALYLALEGSVPCLLGVNTPPDQVAEAAQALGAEVVGISVTDSSNFKATEASVRWLLGKLPHSVELWIGGRAARRLSLEHPRVHFVVTWAELERSLARLKKA